MQCNVKTAAQGIGELLSSSCAGEAFLRRAGEVQNLGIALTRFDALLISDSLLASFPTTVYPSRHPHNAGVCAWGWNNNDGKIINESTWKKAKPRACPSRAGP